jgi:carbamoyl-phosphate synthase large subunit
VVNLRKALTILVTGVGAPGTRGTLYALRNNRDRVRIKVIGTDIKEDVVGKYWVKKFYSVPSPESGNYIERINQICARESIDAIIPQTTRETAVLSRNLSRIKSRVAVSESSAIERANNKYELMKLCREIGIPCPEFFMARSVEELRQRAEQLGYPDNPVVVKPQVSFGSRGFRVLREVNSWDTKRFLSEKPNSTEMSLEDLLRIFERDKNTGFPELLVTQFLPGSEYTVDAFSGQKVSCAIPRIRKEIVNGISFRTSIVYREDIAEHSLKLAKALGLQYAFGFQFKLDGNDAPKILECNPRVQGTMVASFFSGVNVIWMAVREALGNPVQSIPKKPRVSEFYRYWGGLGTFGNQVDEI